MLFKNTQNSYPLRYVHEKSIYIIEKTKNYKCHSHEKERDVLNMVKYLSLVQGFSGFLFGY